MLEFIIDGQTIRRTDHSLIVSDSVGFVKFRARFSHHWKDHTKTFLFKNRKTGECRCVFGVEEKCFSAVPHEVLTPDSEVEVSVFGSAPESAFATANSVVFTVEKNSLSGDFKESVIPDPTLFDQICEKLREALRALPGKNLMLNCDGESIYWKSGEEQEWHLLTPLNALGVNWLAGEDAPGSEDGKSGDFWFVKNGGAIWRRTGDVWEKLFDPQSLLEPVKTESEALLERVRAAIDGMQSGFMGAYGVKFDGASPSGERTGLAIGMRAGVGTDLKEAVNDFDRVNIFAQRRVCGAFDDNGRFLPRAYEGDEDFDPTGAKGDVYLECRLAYRKADWKKGEFSMSAYPLDGYEAFPLFRRRDGSLMEKAYIPAYAMSTDESGRARSVSGREPLLFTSASAMEEAAQKAGSKAHCLLNEVVEYLSVKFMIEFATRDSQSVLGGGSWLISDSSVTAGSASAPAGQDLILSVNAPDDSPELFLPGQRVAVSSKVGDLSEGFCATVLCYCDCALTLRPDGDGSVSVREGQLVWSLPWTCGSCDSVLTPTGSPCGERDPDNRLGYPARYRGCEWMFQGAYMTQWDMLATLSGVSVAIYYLPDIAKRKKSGYSDAYVSAGISTRMKTGYVAEVNCPGEAPQAIFPSRSGVNEQGGADRFYCDENLAPTSSAHYYPFRRFGCVGQKQGAGLFSWGNIYEDSRADHRFSSCLCVDQKG